MRTYLYGYGVYQTRLTEAQLMTKWSWAMVHPEVRRRFIACMNAAQDAGFDLGIGSGARDTQAQLAEALRRHWQVSCSGSYTTKYQGKCYVLKAGQAPYAFPGSSNHEVGVYEGYALAIDVINWENHWFDNYCEQFGLKNFGGLIGPKVNGEEFHGQPLEIPNSRSDVNRYFANGNKLSVWPLPGDNPLPPPVVRPTYSGVSDMFVPIHPHRNSDTRVWPGIMQPNVDGEFGLDFAIFPQNTSAIAMTVTLVGGPPGSYATVWGSGSLPNTSVANFNNEAVVNGVYIGAVVGNKFKIRVTAPMNVICDITGYWTP